MRRVVVLIADWQEIGKWTDNDPYECYGDLPLPTAVKIEIEKWIARNTIAREDGYTAAQSDWEGFLLANRVKHHLGADHSVFLCRGTTPYKYGMEIVEAVDAATLNPANALDAVAGVRDAGYKAALQAWLTGQILPQMAQT